MAHLLGRPSEMCGNKPPLDVSAGFPGGSDSKEAACSSGDPGSIRGSGRSPAEGNGNPLLYSCPENSVEPGGLQFMKQQRIRHDSATDTRNEQLWALWLPLDAGEKLRALPPPLRSETKVNPTLTSSLLCLSVFPDLSYFKRNVEENHQ